MTDTTDNAAKAANTPTFDFAKWEAERRARDALTDAIRPKNKAAIFAFLSEARITSVTVQFDGYGDSGGIEDVHAEQNGERTDLPTGTVKLHTFPWGETKPVENEVTVFAAIEHMAYELLGQTHGGWENNARAYGEFVFDVAAETITLEFNMRFEDTEFFEHTF
ncbi:MAG: DUF6878 family protein [Pseudomonadota bacterium]